MLNPFFLQGSKSEQGLLQDLINEQLRMYGVDIHYLPRQYVTEKTVIKEVIQSEFNNAYPIEAYIESYEGYGDNSTILSKFGIQALNELTLVISRERFKNYISPLIQNQPNIKLSSRPREGDLIYFPLGRRLFEVKYVEHEKPFYQLQGVYTYQLKCELFRYEDELINTGISDVDTVIGGVDPENPGGDSGGGGGDGPPGTTGNLISLTMVGLASTASAIANIINGGVRYITVTNRGGGYTSIPTVGISSSPIKESNANASAIAEMIGGIVVCNENINPQAKSVQRVLVTNPGYGYTVAPGVRFIGGGGNGATAVATIGDGVVGIISVTNPGSGYVESPTITFTGISSIAAEAKAIVSPNGSISEIYLVNAGLGYTVSPTITISNPPITSTGSFTFNEVVRGTQSGVTARVKSWNSITNILQVSNSTGQFIIGENIVGTASSTSHYLKSIDVMITRDGYNENDEIETAANEIIDFNESNPFGMP